METPKPRSKYNFHALAVDDTKKFLLDGKDSNLGERARGAAYAYARRNSMQMCSAVMTIRGKQYMVIRRVA